MSKAVKLIQKEIDANQALIQSLIKKNKALSDDLAAAHGRKKFTFPTGETFNFNELTIVRRDWIDKGLGYSEDVVRFGDYKIRHESIDYDVRLLSNEILVELGVPLNEQGRARVSVEFEHRFKNMVEEIDEGWSFQPKRNSRNM